MKKLLALALALVGLAAFSDVPIPVPGSKRRRSCGSVMAFFALALLGLPARVGAQAVELPKTGQTACYDQGTRDDVVAGSIDCSGTGQDGAIQAGVAWPSPRFTVDVSGNCVTDNLTGLMWVRNPTGSGVLLEFVVWANALDYARNLSMCGYSDWRLPNVNELASLINVGQPRMTAAWLDTQGFSGVANAVNAVVTQFWSSTTFAAHPDRAWVWRLTDGLLTGFWKQSGSWAWPVRGGSPPSTLALANTGQITCYNDSGVQIPCGGSGQDGEIQAGVVWPSPRFTDNSDGTMTDELTGLVWLKQADCFGTWDWINALDAANTLASGQCDLSDGSTVGDWRLPNRNELRSLIHYEHGNSALTSSPAFWLNGQGFTRVSGFEGSAYWSSTTYEYALTNFAWFVPMNTGDVSATFKTFYNYVWPVRDARNGGGSSDTTAPTITVPWPAPVAEATSSAGAIVSYSVSATDPDDAAATPSCSAVSGSLFPLGTTTVDCSSTDTHGNTGTASFAVSVLDTTPPNLSGIPPNASVLATGPGGAAVSWPSPTASDIVDGPVAVICASASGTLFPIGDVSVACNATDAHANTASASFTVHVQGAAEQAATLAALVSGIGPGASLASKVRAVQSEVAVGDTASACESLRTLISEAKAQSGKKLTAAQANAIIAAATRIRAVLAC